MTKAPLDELRHEMQKGAPGERAHFGALKTLPIIVPSGTPESVRTALEEPRADTAALIG